jgi:hypothetical protein
VTLRLALLALITTLSANAAIAASSADDQTKEISLYREKLAEYIRARNAYEKRAAPYWRSVKEKRSRRLPGRLHGVSANLADYILKQPPAYTGPPEPQPPDTFQSNTKIIPVAADFLRHAKEEFNFVPDMPASENDYKRSYVKAALAAGLTRDQCVRIYAFESGGDGTYDVQAGLEYKRPGARAITTALGYNQLLGTNSVEMLAEAGDEFVATLRKRAAVAQGPRKDALLRKIIILKKMIAFSRSVPDRWNEHARLADTPKGLGVHALNLDVDIGPLLQVRKLLTSVEFAKAHGYNRPLSAAELEMMNLTGDGNGFDMVVMPNDMRTKVPTSNFFQPGGYERNPVASVNDTVAKLFSATNAKMDSESQLSGAKSLAALFDTRR